MRHFDLKTFHRHLDGERQRRGLSWVQLAQEVNRPFITTPSIPIHPATLRDMPKKRSVTSAVVLQVLRWLGESPEAFLFPSFTGLLEEAKLPHTEPDQILRFDTMALHAALDAERRMRGMTWQQVAKQLPGFQAGMLTNLASGPLIGFPRVMLLTQWLGVPAAQFVRARLR